MRIDQYVPVLSYGDAIGNDALAIKKLLLNQGFETTIFSDGIDSRLTKEGFVINNFPDYQKNDILIYHLSNASLLCNKFINLKCKKVVIFHNTTPPTFFSDYSEPLYNACISGINEMYFLADKVDYAIADSEFNKIILINAGYQCPIEVVPLLIPFEDYKTEPNPALLEQFNDGNTNVLFVGRVAPNKKIEDVIRAFCCYKQNFDNSSRLVVAGNYGGVFSSYYTKLIEYITKLKCDDIYFTGHINFEDLLACYRSASVFLCMSDHEGFCVPLLESMLFDVPVVAYSSTAIPYTLKDSGVLLNDKNPKVTACVINELMTNSLFKNSVLDKQRKRLGDFSKVLVEKQFLNIINTLIVRGN